MAYTAEDIRKMREQSNNQTSRTKYSVEDIASMRAEQKYKSSLSNFTPEEAIQSGQLQENYSLPIQRNLTIKPAQRDLTYDDLMLEKNVNEADSRMMSEVPKNNFSMTRRTPQQTFYDDVKSGIKPKDLPFEDYRYTPEYRQAVKQAVQAEDRISKVDRKPINEQNVYYKQPDFLPQKLGAGDAFGSKFLDSATLGASSQLQKKFNPENAKRFEKVQQENPGASLAGTIGGYVLPGSLAEKGVATVAKPILQKVGSEIGKRAIIGGVAGGGMELAEGLVRQEKPSDIAKRVALGTGLGVGAELLGSIAPIVNKLKNNKPLTITEQIKYKSAVKTNPQLQKNLEAMNIKTPIETPIPNSNIIKKPEADKFIQPYQFQDFGKGEKLINNKPFKKTDEIGLNSNDYSNLINEYKAEKQKVLNDQIEYLKNSQKKGVTQGMLIKDSNGNVINRVGRISNNEKWYKDFYSENKRPPNKKELEQLAEKQLKNGYESNDGIVSPNEYYNNLDNEILNSITKKDSLSKPQKFTLKKQEAINLPDDEASLKKIVDDLEEEKFKGFKIDLQLFAAAKDKLEVIMKKSKFRTNTIERATDIPNDIKNNILKPDAFDYIPETVKEWDSNAIKNVVNNRDEVISKIQNADAITSGTMAHEAAIISKQLLDEAVKSGSYAKYRVWMENIAEKTRETARALKGTDSAWEKQTAEGAVLQGTREVKKAEKAIEEANPKRIEKVNKEIKEAKEIVEKTHKETAKKVVEELSPEQLLANKIGGTLKEGSSKQSNPITDMVNELFKSAKESPLPENINKAKNNPIAYLKQAIQNKGEYADVWEKAKAILKEKYLDEPLLDDYFDKGIIPTYSDKTLNASVKQSMKDLEQKIVDIAKSSSGDKEKALKSLTEHLVTNTGATLDDATLLAKKIQTRFDEVVKEKSQSILKNMFKEPVKKGQKSQFDKVMELMNLGAYDDASIRDLIKAKEGLPVLDDSDVKNIVNFMNKANSLPNGYDKNMWLSRAKQIIADKQTATLREKGKGLQRISLILNPRSLISRNPLGNTILGTAENLKDIPGSLIDKAVSLKTGNRTTTGLGIDKLKAQYEGFKQGLTEFGKDIKNNVDTNPTRGQLELPSKRVFKNDTLNAIDQFQRKALQLGDRPYYQSAYNSRISELKKLGKIGEEAEIDARLYGLDRVFQNDSVLSKSAKKIQDAMGVVGDVILPFTQTPANVLDKLIDYTPGGLVKGLYHLGTTAGKGTFNQKLFVDRLARAFTGTGIGILGYTLANKGLITGGANKDADVRNFEQSVGKTPYALKFGDKYFTVDWAQPIAGLLAAGADAYFAGKDKKDFVSKISAGTEGAINTMFKQSFLQNLTNLMSGYSPAAGLAKAGLGATTQITPTFGSNISKMIDPFVRETYDTNVIKQTGKKLAARIPFASKALPIKVDVMGNEIKQQQGKGIGTKAFNLFLNPGQLTDFKPDNTQKEILRLSQVGFKNQVPTIVEKNIPETTTHEAVVLTPEEFTQYQKRTGELTMTAFEKLMQEVKYKNAVKTKDKTVDEVKADLLADKIKEAKAKAKKELLTKKGLK